MDGTCQLYNFGSRLQCRPSAVPFFRFRGAKTTCRNLFRLTVEENSVVEQSDSPAKLYLFESALCLINRMSDADEVASELGVARGLVAGPLVRDGLEEVGEAGEARAVVAEGEQREQSRAALRGLLPSPGCRH